MSSESKAYWKGVRDGAPFVLVVGPFGLLFGVVGSEAGLNLAEVMGFSVLVIAGASQFAALSLMQDNAPTLIVVATAVAVNMRMAMYSASLTPHLGGAPIWQRAIAAYFLVDQSYAVGVSTFERRPEMTGPEKIAYYFGVVTPICPLWYVSTLLGAVLGTQIPESMALDFAVPITFLAIIAPMLRTFAHLAAAFVSIALALVLGFLPYNLWLLIAAAAAMVTGAEIERRMVRAGTWK